MHLLTTSASLAFILSTLFTITSSQSPYTYAYNFRLITYVTSNDLTPSLTNWILNPSPTTPFAYLTPPSTPAQVYYVNGTAWDSFHSVATLLYDSDDTPSSVPYGMIYSPSTSLDSLGRRAVQFQPGSGEVGVGIVPYPGWEPKLYMGSGYLYACAVENSEVRVFYRQYDEVKPAGCADITVLAECVDDGATHEAGTYAYCCLNVTAVHCTAG